MKSFKDTLTKATAIRNFRTNISEPCTVPGLTDRWDRDFRLIGVVSFLKPSILFKKRSAQISFACIR